MDRHTLWYIRFCHNLHTFSGQINLALTLFVQKENYMFALTLPNHHHHPLGEEGEAKLSFEDESLMADLTFDEMKQAFRWVTCSRNDILYRYILYI